MMLLIHLSRYTSPVPDDWGWMEFHTKLPVGIQSNTVAAVHKSYKDKAHPQLCLELQVSGDNIQDLTRLFDVPRLSLSGTLGRYFYQTTTACARPNSGHALSFGLEQIKDKRSSDKDGTPDRETQYARPSRRCRA